GECWIRTCPSEQEPGLFTTQRGWRDPFALLTKEDQTGKAIASVISQHGIEAHFSGTGSIAVNEDIQLEGVRGYGDRYMLGERPPAPLPPRVATAVKRVLGDVLRLIGPVRIEWVYDGDTAWIVQLHVGAPATSGDVLVPGNANNWIVFDARQGLS